MIKKTKTKKASCKRTRSTVITCRKREKKKKPKQFSNQKYWGLERELNGLSHVLIAGDPV